MEELVNKVSKEIKMPVEVDIIQGRHGVVKIGGTITFSTSGFHSYSAIEAYLMGLESGIVFEKKKNKISGGIEQYY